MTKRNTYGNRKYLFIDTERKLFINDSPSIQPPDNTVEIKSKDINKLCDILHENRYSRTKFEVWREG